MEKDNNEPLYQMLCTIAFVTGVFLGLVLKDVTAL